MLHSPTPPTPLSEPATRPTGRVAFNLNKVPMTTMQALDRWSKLQQQLLWLQEQESGRDQRIRYAADIHTLQTQRIKIESEKQHLRAIINQIDNSHAPDVR